MTTIAFKSGVMAADTQSTGDSAICRVQKLWRLPDGGVVGFCGLTHRGYLAAKWMADGERGDPPDIDGVWLLIARPDGSLWAAEGAFPPYPLLDTVTAHGCGREPALMAMAQGHSAVEAVFAVSAMDAATSPPVLSMQVCATYEYPGPAIHAKPPKRTAAPKRRSRG